MGAPQAPARSAHDLHLARLQQQRALEELRRMQESADRRHRLEERKAAAHELLQRHYAEQARATLEKARRDAEEAALAKQREEKRKERARAEQNARKVAEQVGQEGGVRRGVGEGRRAGFGPRWRRWKDGRRRGGGEGRGEGRTSRRVWRSVFLVQWLVNAPSPYPSSRRYIWGFTLGSVLP